MTKAILLTVCVLSISGFAQSFASEPREPNRAPGMMKEEGGHMGPPRDQMSDLTDIKFEFDTKNGLFKNADEAKEFQALFDKYKTSKEITEHFSKVTEENKSKMEEMRKPGGKRPDFSKMQEEREASKLALYKDIKTILEKKKKDNIAAVTLNEDVKCGGGKNLPVIEKATTESMKDSAKVAKIILTEEELVKMKKEMKEELKKEMMKEMAENKPKDMDGDRGERPSKGDKPKMDDEEGAPKMAEGKNKKGGRAGGMGAMGNMGGMGGGQEASTVAMFSSQMSGMGQMQMGGSQMMGNSQMNSQMNAQGSQSNQMTRDQMIQNAIRVPTMNFNQQNQNQNYGYQNQQMNQQQMMPQMNQQSQMQMRRPQQMNQNYGYQNQMNQKYGYQNQMGQNYGYQANYQMNAYQSNVGQNYYGSTNSQYGYNLVAPQLDYGYTGSNSMMPAAYSGQTYQYQQAIPSYSQYSFMGY